MPAEKFYATSVMLGAKKNADGSPALVRFSHLHVFEPHLNTESKKQEYSVWLWIPKTSVADAEALKAAYDEQVAAYKKKTGDAPGPMWHNPIKDGDTMTDKRGRPKLVPGHWVISAKTAAEDDKGNPVEPPGFVGTERGADGKLKPLAKGAAKSGDWGRVSINLKFFEKGVGGVSAYLNNLQKVQDGEPLGGGRKAAADEFADFDDADDPLA